MDEFEFIGESVAALPQRVGLEGAPEVLPEPERMPADYPPPLIDISTEKMDDIKRHLDDWLHTLDSDQQDKQTQWREQEEGYRALPKLKKFPFKGAAGEVIPVIAMAVDPIHARLDTGIFKQDPVYTLKGLKKSVLPFIPALTAWIDFYQKHYLRLRQVSSPRILECTKLGTMVFKTVFHKEQVRTLTYDSNFEVVPQEFTAYKGPKVFGISLGDFLFPPHYQFIHDCPIVAERQRTSYGALKRAEASNRLTNVDAIKGQETADKTDLEMERGDVVKHTTTRVTEDLVVYECWFDYDIDGDGVPEKLVATYHLNTRTLLQLRYNWYFHQRYPYTVIPYAVSNDSLYGIGIGEMTKPFQDAITKFYQMAADNAYLANIRMFIAKKNSGIEDVPRVYAGRVFFVDEPSKDFIPFAGGDIYPSTLVERQNLFGLVEKRTGVSDYLVGRESPIIGSRATATSTLALIQEGTRRVEEVLENLRLGFAEIMENCIYIWIQYGLGDVDELVFGDDDIGIQLKNFFSTITKENVAGAIAIDLTATDAAGNRQAQQQMQLQIIQVMMQYLEKVLAAGQAALQAQQSGMPQMTEMIKEVMRSARKLFTDLLHKYDIRNPEDYIPDLEQFLNGNGTGPGIGGAAQGLPGGPEAGPGVPAGNPALAGPAVPGPGAPGAGAGGGGGIPFTG